MYFGDWPIMGDALLCTELLCCCTPQYTLQQPHLQYGRGSSRGMELMSRMGEK